MRSYAYGREKEIKSRDMLRKQGYTVMRAAASKSPFDLVAWKRGEPVKFVQVKSTRLERKFIPQRNKAIETMPVEDVPITAEVELWLWLHNDVEVLRHSLGAWKHV